MKRKKRYSLSLLSFFGIIIAICITSIGYSAFNSNLRISGEAIVKVDNNISIVEVNASEIESEAYEQYNNTHHISTIDFHIVLPNPDSTITYKIDIKNKSKRDYGIALINGLPDELTYELIGYNLGEKLCTGNSCNNGAVDEVFMKIKYKSEAYDSENTTFAGRIKIEFGHFYTVLYKNIPNSSTLKSEVLRKSTYEENIPILENYRMKVRMNGVILVENTDYTYNHETSTLTIPNVSSNLVIYFEQIGGDFDLSLAGNYRMFEYQDVDYNVNNKTFYFEADLSQIDLNNALENILSIGNDIGNWNVSYSKPKGANMHMYYPAAANNKSIQIDITYLSEANKQSYTKFQKNLSLTNSDILRVAFNDNGLFINGDKVFDKTGKDAKVGSTLSNPTSFLGEYFDCWETNSLSTSIGSIEGNNRSNAIYNEMIIYDQLFTPAELKELTKIQLEEMPLEEETTYNSVSSVLLNGSQALSINYPFLPDNNKFVFTNPEFVDLNSNSLYFEIDVSNIKENATLENLISVGNNISSWVSGNVYNLHVFYPYEANTNNILFALQNGGSYYGQFRGDVELIDGKLIKLVFCSRGIYINGEKWFDPSGSYKAGLTIFGAYSAPQTIVSEFFKKFTMPNDNNIRFKYGSEQGDSRSSATYNDMRVYNGVLTENEIISLTS